MIPKMLLPMQSVRTYNACIKYALLCLSLLLHVQTFAKPSRENWLLAKQTEHIKIHTVEDVSGYVWLKATITVKGVPEDFLTLLDNTAIAASWIDNCEKVELLASPSPVEKIVKTTFNAPWPAKDREMITKSFTEIDSATHTIRIQVQDYSEYYPPNNTLVRIQNVRGNWRITATSKNTMQIEYIGYGEPSGNLPIWRANKLVVSSMFKTFHNLGEIFGAPTRF
ncbi:START domain-containing protein [Aliiglaciecola sp. NS0011-25]|uniref:START domain-containing protein n=1 Tax=Aliiglaciecola sp. NS0011-25 TaxID=3127654 RepID=UPI003107E365